ncbi:transglycosylase SLT domain-containing protein [Candidatus Peregrinibacteria bacterium]|nr:MAG: transglycosylase SLT domain-containing protein [Candidatus Peregrinibacteria bacterium]
MKTFWNTFSAESPFLEKRRVFQDSEKPKTEETPEENALLQETQPLLHDLAERVEAMRNMSEGEFLKKERAERLALITEPSAKPEDITTGKEININFHGNKELERRITAGQTLPATVQKITVTHRGEPSQTGTRRGLSGEFFAENGERLIILYGTKVTIETTQTQEQVQQKTKEIEEKSQSFVNSYVSEKTEKVTFQERYEAITKACYKQDIDPKYVFAVLEDAEQKTDIEIEIFLTEIQKGIDYYRRSTGKSAIENGKLTADFLVYQHYGKPELNKICNEYGISSGDLQKAIQKREEQWKNSSGELMKDPEFRTRYAECCKRIGVSESDLAIVIQAESKFNPRAVNHISNATGLIQFMPSTARGLGTSVSALRNMSATEQLTYVEKYFAPYRGKLHSAHDLYLATFYPYALGKSDSFRFGSEKSDAYARTVANQNEVISKGAPYITRPIFKSYVDRKSFA